MDDENVQRPGVGQVTGDAVAGGGSEPSGTALPPDAGEAMTAGVGPEPVAESGPTAAAAAVGASGSIGSEPPADQPRPEAAPSEPAGGGVEPPADQSRPEAAPSEPAGGGAARSGGPVVPGVAGDAGEQMGTLLAGMEQEYREPQRGETVEGVIVRIDDDGVLVDIGTKSEGLIPNQEIGRARPGEELQVGETVLVYVLQPENQEGHAVLSLNRARAERGWRNIQKQFDANETIEAEIVDFNKGGLIANVQGVRGFVPMSQVAGLRGGTPPEQAETKLKSMIGQTLPLKILEINRKRNRLILSERAAAQERRGLRKDQLIAELEEGQIRTGRVSSITDFGAFIDLGGADGLAHVSELSWSPVQHPRDVLNVGDEVQAYVLGVDRERKKIALSLKRAQPEPWSTVHERFTVGQTVTARVTKLATFGAFARLESGIEGLIHLTEMGDGRAPHPKNVVQEGDVVNARILRIEPERKRIGLSTRGVPQSTDPDRESAGPAGDEFDATGQGPTLEDQPTGRADTAPRGAEAEPASWRGPERSAEAAAAPPAPPAELRSRFTAAPPQPRSEAPARQSQPARADAQPPRSQTELPPIPQQPDDEPMSAMALALLQAQARFQGRSELARLVEAATQSPGGAGESEGGSAGAGGADEPSAAPEATSPAPERDSVGESAQESR